MSRVRAVLDDLRLRPIRDPKYNQTSRISYASYCKLRQLSDFLGVPASRLAGQLLTAAIDDAIEGLDNTETQIWETGSGIEETAQQFVIRQADQQYRLSLKLEEISSEQGILSDQGIVRDGLTA